MFLVSRDTVYSSRQIAAPSGSGLIRSCDLVLLAKRGESIDSFTIFTKSTFSAFLMSKDENNAINLSQPDESTSPGPGRVPRKISQSSGAKLFPIRGKKHPKQMQHFTGTSTLEHKAKYYFCLHLPSIFSYFSLIGHFFLSTLLLPALSFFCILILTLSSSAPNIFSDNFVLT